MSGLMSTRPLIAQYSLHRCLRTAVLCRLDRFASRRLPLDLIKQFKVCVIRHQTLIDDDGITGPPATTR